MKTIPSLVIKNMAAEVAIVQGGMGVGISLAPLAAAVAREGGIGIISSACLDRLVSRRLGRQVNVYEAIIEEIKRARQLSDRCGLIGVNIMVALQQDYEASVRGAIDGGADLIISGAGLPMTLPSIRSPRNTALVPIVSSARALELICKKWDRPPYPYRPDAVVLEGPLAGGHLGFKIPEINDPRFSLEVLLPQVKVVSERWGGFPIIVAGGIYSQADIRRFIAKGADAVQMGTRFLVTKESSATVDYKQAVVDATVSNIEVVMHSPCHLPFRVLTKSPMYQQTLVGLIQPRCDKSYVLQKNTATGLYTECPAKINCQNFFCICNGLLTSAGYQNDPRGGLYTVGTNASKVNQITSVRELMNELTR